MSNKLSTLIATMLLISCNSAREIGQTSKDLMISATALEFQPYYSKHDIPKGLRKGYRKFYMESLLMADKDREFNPFDVRERGVPDRRFIFGANSDSNGYQLFVYEEGGVGLKNYCIISKKGEGGKWSIQRVYLYRRASDINELKEVISKKEYSISNRN